MGKRDTNGLPCAAYLIRMQEKDPKQKAVHPDAAETLEYEVGEGDTVQVPDGSEREEEEEEWDESQKDDEHVDYVEELACELHPNYLEVSAPDVVIDGLDSDNGEGDKNHETKGTHKDCLPV